MELSDELYRIAEELGRHHADYAFVKLAAHELARKRCKGKAAETPLLTMLRGYLTMERFGASDLRDALTAAGHTDLPKTKAWSNILEACGYTMAGVMQHNKRVQRVWRKK